MGKQVGDDGEVERAVCVNEFNVETCYHTMRPPVSRIENDENKVENQSGTLLVRIYPHLRLYINEARQVLFNPFRIRFQFLY